MATIQQYQFLPPVQLHREPIARLHTFEALASPPDIANRSQTLALESVAAFLDSLKESRREGGGGGGGSERSGRVRRGRLKRTIAQQTDTLLINEQHSQQPGKHESPETSQFHNQAGNYINQADLQSQLELQQQQQLQQLQQLQLQQEQTGQQPHLIEFENEAAYPFQQPPRKGYIAYPHHQQHKNKKPVYVTISQQTVNGLLSLLLLFILSICGCMGSIFIISALTVIESLQTRGNCYLVSLALGHLLVSLLVIPSSAIQIMAGDSINSSKLCHYQWLVLEFSMIVSQFSFLLMAADNYLGYKSSEKLITQGQIGGPINQVQQSINGGVPAFPMALPVSNPSKNVKPDSGGGESEPHVSDRTSANCTGNIDKGGASLAKVKQQQQQQQQQQREQDRLLMSKHWAPLKPVESRATRASAIRRLTCLIGDLVTWLAICLVPCSAKARRRRKWIKASKEQRAIVKFAGFTGQDLEFAKLSEPGCFSYRNCCGRLKVLLWTISVWLLAFVYIIHQQELSYGPKFCQNLSAAGAGKSGAGNGSSSRFIVMPGNSAKRLAELPGGSIQPQWAAGTSLSGTANNATSLQSSLQRPITTTTSNHQMAPRERRHSAAVAASYATGWGSGKSRFGRVLQNKRASGGSYGAAGSLPDQLSRIDKNGNWPTPNADSQEELAGTSGSQVEALPPGINIETWQSAKLATGELEVSQRDSEIAKLQASGNPDEHSLEEEEEATITTKSFRSVAQPKSHPTGSTFVSPKRDDRMGMQAGNWQRHRQEQQPQQQQQQGKKRSENLLPVSRITLARGAGDDDLIVFRSSASSGFTGQPDRAGELTATDKHDSNQVSCSSVGRLTDADADEDVHEHENEAAEHDGDEEETTADLGKQATNGTFNVPSSLPARQSGHRRLHRRKRSADNDGLIAAGGSRIKAATTATAAVAVAVELEKMSHAGRAALRKDKKKMRKNNNGSEFIVVAASGQIALARDFAKPLQAPDSYHRNERLMGDSLNQQKGLGRSRAPDKSDGYNDHNGEADNKLPGLLESLQFRGGETLDLPGEPHRWMMPGGAVLGDPIESAAESSGQVNTGSSDLEATKNHMYAAPASSASDKRSRFEVSDKHDRRETYLPAYYDELPLAIGLRRPTENSAFKLAVLPELEAKSRRAHPASEISSSGPAVELAEQFATDRSIVQDLNDNLMNNNNDGSGDHLVDGEAAVRIGATGGQLTASSAGKHASLVTAAPAEAVANEQPRLANKRKRQTSDGSLGNKAQMANNNAPTSARKWSSGPAKGFSQTRVAQASQSEQLMGQASGGSLVAAAAVPSNSTTTSTNTGLQQRAPRRHYWLMLLGTIVLPSLGSAILFARAYCRMKEFKMRPYKPLPPMQMPMATLVEPPSKPALAHHCQVVAVAAQYQPDSSFAGSSLEANLAGLPALAESNTTRSRQISGDDNAHDRALSTKINGLVQNGTSAQAQAIKGANNTSNAPHEPLEWPANEAELMLMQQQRYCGINNAINPDGAQVSRIDRSVSQASASSSFVPLQGCASMQLPGDYKQQSPPLSPPYKIRRQQVNQVMSAPIGFDHLRHCYPIQNKLEANCTNNWNPTTRRISPTLIKRPGNPGSANTPTSRPCLFPIATGNHQQRTDVVNLERFDCNSAASFSAPPTASFRQDHYDVFGSVDISQHQQQQQLPFRQASEQAPLNELALAGNDSSKQTANSELAAQHEQQQQQQVRICTAAGKHQYEFRRSHNHAQSFHYGYTGRQHVQNTSRLAGDTYLKANGGAVHLQQTAGGLVQPLQYDDQQQQQQSELEEQPERLVAPNSFGMRHLTMAAGRSPQHLSPSHGNKQHQQINSGYLPSSGTPQHLLERHCSLPRSSRLYQSEAPATSSHLYDSPVGEQMDADESVVSSKNARKSLVGHSSRRRSSRRRQVATVHHQGCHSLEQAGSELVAAGHKLVAPEDNVVAVSVALASVIKSIDGAGQLALPRSTSVDSKAAASSSFEQANERAKSALESSRQVVVGSTLMKSNECSRIGGEPTKSSPSNVASGGQKHSQIQRQTNDGVGTNNKCSKPDEKLLTTASGKPNLAGGQQVEATKAAIEANQISNELGEKSTRGLNSGRATFCTYSYMTDDQLLKSNIIVFILNLTLWFPLVLLIIAAQYREQFTQELKDSVWWLATLNCCSCSYVYALTNKDFREAFNKLFYYCCCKSHVTFQKKTPIFRRQLEVDSKGNLRVHIIPGLNVFSSKLAIGGGGDLHANHQHPTAQHQSGHLHGSHHHHHHHHHHHNNHNHHAHGIAGTTGGSSQAGINAGGGAHYRHNSHAPSSSADHSNSGGGLMAVRHHMPVGFAGGFGCPLFASTGGFLHHQAASNGHSNNKL